jgi:hypothetical protein
VYVRAHALKQVDTLSSLLFNLSLEYGIGKVQKKHVGLEVNGSHQLLVNADDVRLLRDNMETIRKTQEH